MLQLKDIKKSFRQPDGTALPVLDIPEFRVGEGEQMVMVGRSGCGKTTLLHIIAGIGRPDTGKVRIDDWDITLMPEAEVDRFRAERIGYVFQDARLFPHLSVSGLSESATYSRRLICWRVSRHSKTCFYPCGLRGDGPIRTGQNIF